MSQRGPWDISFHYDRVTGPSGVEYVRGPSAARPVQAHEERGAALFSPVPPPPAHPIKRTANGPHPFEDLFDETHIDLLA